MADYVYIPTGGIVSAADGAALPASLFRPAGAQPAAAAPKPATRKQLLALAAEYGIEVPRGAKVAEISTLIEQAQADAAIRSQLAPEGAAADPRAPGAVV